MPLLDLTTWKRCIIDSIQKDPKTWELILKLREDKCSPENVNTEQGLCRLQGPWYILTYICIFSDFIATKKNCQILGAQLK